MCKGTTKGEKKKGRPDFDKLGRAFLSLKTPKP
jgi:hypothetical protein